MRKKLLSIVLSVALVLGSVNVTTLAAEQYGADVSDEVVFELQEDIEEKTSDTAIEDGNMDEELAEEHENLEFDAEEVSEQVIEDRSEEEDTKESTQEDLRDAQNREDSYTETSTEDASDLIIVEGELEGVYQFGDAPSERKVAAYSMRSGEDENVAAAEYIYQEIMKHNETIDISKYSLSWESAYTIVVGLLNDYPELYFVGKTISGSTSGSSGNCIYIKLTYDETLDEKAFYDAADAALACVNSGMSELEKAITLHDYLAVNCEYDYDNYLADNIPSTSYSAYGVLVNRIAVCQGYALAYEYLLNQVGISAYMVDSRSMNHAWNLIVLDGEYYQVDVTWDDPTWDLVGRAVHTYMFCSDDAFAKHYGWTVTKGGYPVDYKATDTSYDNAFWKNIRSPLVLAGDGCYYTAYDSTTKMAKIKKTNLSDVTAVGEDICDIGR